MLTGIKFQAHPKEEQKLVLSQWMGCSRSIWNAKVDENKYYSTFARKYYPERTFAPVDQKAAQFKDKELSPWLYKCPSQILRNSAVNWYNTYQNFMKGMCGKPKHKAKKDQGSIYLTKELFRFDTCEDGNLRLFIGTKTNNIGYLSFKKNRNFKAPNSLYIRKKNGTYFVSFCYDNGKDESVLLSPKEHLSHLSKATEGYLDKHTVGIDRGVTIAAHAGQVAYNFTAKQKKKMAKTEKYRKKMQRRLAKQKMGSNRRRKTKKTIAGTYEKTANIRTNFCHQTSRKLVDSQAKVFVFEALQTSKMSKKAKAKQDPVTGKYLRNNAAAKSGLNKAILNVGWHQLETYVKYKAYAANKIVFKIHPSYTSQECAKCGHIHKDNRKTQEKFVCLSCHHTDNADRNAALVIKKRAIELILDSGTELVGAKTSILRLTKGRGEIGKTGAANASPALLSETSKKFCTLQLETTM